MTEEEMYPFKVYERYIEQTVFFVVCNTRMPYPKCIEAYHNNWHQAQAHCDALNKDAYEKSLKQNAKRIITEDEIYDVIDGLDYVLRIIQRIENIKIKGNETDWWIENDAQIDVASLRVIENIMNSKCEMRKHL